ncbi:MAG: sugar ABC transporter ATP-binding protein [Eubacteriales bacterium]|nr:sugar ABC transporter ATP-binding protein [Eubacteriales bacterium]
MGEILLKADKIDKHFGITHALDHVSLTFEKGEIHALIGENGSGKSTITSCLAGIHKKDSGTFILEGKEINAANQVDANHQGVAIIVQEIGTLSGLTVAENIFLGNEDMFTSHGIKNTSAMNKKAQEYLDSYGFSYIEASRVIDDYNFEDRKLIEIVKATYFNPKILVVDETTTALGQKGREELFKVMHRVRDTGNCVIFISHDLEEVIEQSDNISVLRDGVMIGSISKAEATPDVLKKLMVGREIGDSYYRTDYDEKISSEVVISAKNLAVKGQIDNLSLELHKGEILGIGGLSECGMHEVGKALFGASYFREGSVTLGDGTPINSIPDAIKHSIAYASKDRDNESLVINDTICENICLPSLEELKTGGILRGSAMKKFADKFARQMSTKMTGVDQFVSALSGGNKQKVVLARWIGKDSDLIILDSPTRGIDVKVKADIYNMMNNMRKSGKSIIMISEEIMELLGMADRILIMKDGRINGEFLRSRDLKDTDLIEKMI